MIRILRFGVLNSFVLGQVLFLRIYTILYRKRRHDGQ